MSTTGVMLMVTSDFPPIPGGISRYLFDLWTCLPPVDVVILAPSVSGAIDIDDGIACQVMRVAVPLGGGAIRQVLRTTVLAWWILRLSRRFELCSIHCGQVMSGLAAWFVASLRRIPYIPYAHGADLRENGTRFILGRVLRAVLVGAEKVIVNSKDTAALVQELGVATGHIGIVNPSIDISRFEGPRNREQVRQQYGWKGRRVILTVARLVERKGHDMIIRCLPRLADAVPDVHYAIAGSGPYRERLLALAGDEQVESRVQFLGFVDESSLADLYAAADVFAMISREIPEAGDAEGFGIVFLEANAAGTAVVAGRSGGIADAVEDGVSGLLVDPEDVQQIADTFARLFEDAELSNKLVAQARQRVRKRFDRRLSAARLMAFCNSDRETHSVYSQR